ncbi:esterase family protein [uncultured Rossellomorea sp.]|uniref:alpha/beta hydrolase n=1 Tax=uncultured Rossellomorea sp. TaxID=2837549 RepID=UPI00262C9110|nr:alpha/beta hydrolase-fold protein [uncultured Rossellomorea sp.]
MVSLISSLREHQMMSHTLGKKLLYYTLEVKQGHSDAVDILFVQDGRDYIELGHLHQALHQVLQGETGRGLHLLLVLVPPSTSEERYHYYHPSGKHHDQYIQFFNQELVPHIEKRVESTGKESRKTGLLGDSLGAAICLTIACDQPQKWTHLLLQSGAYTDFHACKIRNIETKVPWHVYQTVGIQEISVIYPITGEAFSILSANRALHERLQLITENHTYVEEDEDHLWDFWRRDLPRALHSFLTKG